MLLRCGVRFKRGGFRAATGRARVGALGPCPLIGCASMLVSLSIAHRVSVVRLGFLHAAWVFMWVGCVPASDTPEFSDPSSLLNFGALSTPCETSAACDSPLLCVCGVCTLTCAGPSECTGAQLGLTASGLSTVCLGADGVEAQQLCGGEPPAGGLCGARCDVDTDCAGDPNTYVCRSGLCAASWSSPRPVAPDAGATSDVGSDDAIDGGDTNADGSGQGTAECLGFSLAGPDVAPLLEDVRGCTVIDGNVVLDGVENVDLTTLSALRRITGNLTLRNGSIAGTTIALPALTEVAGAVRIEGVRTVDGLRWDSVALPELRAAFSVELVRLDANRIELGSLTELTEGFRLSEMSGLSSMAGLTLPSEWRAGVSIEVSGNGSLQRAEALFAIASLPADATVRVSDNPQLPACAVANWLAAAWPDASEEDRLAANAGNDEDATCP